jgi:beta-lactamase regulating signal transducer with metallopeptidase domain/protocatechuate 3,4-dioxygenase beta subunit
MNTILDSVGPLVRALFENSVKAALLACIVGVICLLVRRWISPGWRHALWCTVFVRLILPDVPLPAWRWNVSEVFAAAAMGRVIDPAAEGQVPRASVGTAAQGTIGTPLAWGDSMDGGARPPAEVERLTTQVAATSPLEWRQILMMVWLFGTAAWWAALCIAWWRFRRRVLRTSTEATEASQDVLESCLAEAGVRAPLALRITPHIGTPAVCGVFRQVILLPSGLESSISASDLRLLLLHELGHVRRRDPVLQVFASVLLGLHWWNPLLWFAWHQLRNDAEAATDAWVLRRTDPKSASSYGAMLLMLASRACAASVALLTVPSLIGVAASGRRLKRRIRDITANHSTGFHSMAPGLLLMSLLVAAGFSQEAAKKSPAPGATTVGESNDADVIGGVVVDEKGQPIAGAEVEVAVTPIRGRLVKSVVPSGYNAPPPVRTDSEGRWQLRGVPAGVWPMTTDNVGAGKDTYQFHVTHPEFLYRQFNSAGEVPLESDPAFRARTAKLTLKRGLVLRGVVSDESGTPIAGAIVTRNPSAEKHGDPAASTDAAGRYELKAARAGNLAVRVVAKGYGTQLHRVSMQADSTKDFTMQKGQNLTLKLRDDKDQPLIAFKDQRVPTPLVTIYPSGDGWQSGERLWSSEGAPEDGMVIWEDAPAGELVAEIAARGFARVTRKVTAGDQILLKLSPADRLPGITLRVADGDTGAPLTRCRIATGTVVSTLRDTPSTWLPESTGVAFKASGDDGTYTGRIREGHSKSRLSFCIRHEGYEPVITSSVVASQGDAALDVKLKRGTPVEVNVRDEQGKNVPAAKLYVLWQSDFLSLKNFDLRSASGMDDLEFVGATGPDGRCLLPPCAADSVLLAVHETGFAASAWADVARRQSVVLGLYAQVEALVTQNGKPAPGTKCEYYGSTDLPGGRRVSLVIDSVSDAEGRLQFPRVFPTSSGLVREAVVRTSQPGRGTVFNTTGGYRRVPAGMTTSFQIEVKAPTFRQLTGKLVLKGGGVPTSSRTQQVSVYLNKPSASGLQFMIGSARMDDEGKFTFEGVAPGAYNITLALRYEGSPQARYSFADGKTGAEITVPAPTPESTGKPVDIGVFEVVGGAQKN